MAYMLNTRAKKAIPRVAFRARTLSSIFQVLQTKLARGGEGAERKYGDVYAFSVEQNA